MGEEQEVTQSELLEPKEEGESQTEGESQEEGDTDW